MSYEETSFNLGLSEPVSVTICELNIIFGSELLTRQVPTHLNY